MKHQSQNFSALILKWLVGAAVLLSSSIISGCGEKKEEGDGSEPTTAKVAEASPPTGDEYEVGPDGNALVRLRLAEGSEGLSLLEGSLDVISTDGATVNCNGTVVSPASISIENGTTIVAQMERTCQHPGSTDGAVVPRFAGISSILAAVNGYEAQILADTVATMFSSDLRCTFRFAERLVTCLQGGSREHSTAVTLEAGPQVATTLSIEVSDGCGHTSFGPLTREIAPGRIDDGEFGSGAWIPPLTMDVPNQFICEYPGSAESQAFLGSAPGLTGASHLSWGHSGSLITVNPATAVPGTYTYEVRNTSGFFDPDAGLCTIRCILTIYDSTLPGTRYNDNPTTGT